MNWITKNPVAALTLLFLALSAFDGGATASHLLTPTVAGWLEVGIGVLAAILGYATHQSVTPLVAPRDASGRPLVPVSAVNPPPGL